VARQYSYEKSCAELRGIQIFHILQGCAFNRMTKNYEWLSGKLGYPGTTDLQTSQGLGVGRVLAWPLGRLMSWCLDHSLPPITVLVVNKKTGKPGVGLVGTTDFDAAREAVFAYNWYDIIDPTFEELAKYRKGGEEEVPPQTIKEQLRACIADGRTRRA